MEKTASPRRSFSPNSVVTIILLIAAFCCGIWLTRCYFEKTATHSTENSTILLEQIRQVCKLITIEGQFAEVYEYKDFKGYDISFFSKKALVRVKAKVSVGYNLDLVKMTALPEQKLIKITNLPKPEILSIDHSVDYYDITEGTFNSFTTDDYNRIQADAKNRIYQNALQSNLMTEAAKQGLKNLDMIRLMAESMGWKVEIESPGAAPAG